MLGPILPTMFCHIIRTFVDVFTVSTCSREVFYIQLLLHPSESLPCFNVSFSSERYKRGFCCVDAQPHRSTSFIKSENELILE